MLYRLLYTILWPVIALILLWSGGIKIEGRENVPRKGGLLITPNHRSDSDPLVLGFSLPRSCWGFAKSELFEGKFLAWMIRGLQGMPIKRYTADHAALRRGERILESGEALIIFPEGQLTEDGKTQPFLPGALLLARSTGVPILPTALIHTDLVVPYGKTLPQRARKTVIVKFGTPVLFEELAEGRTGKAALLHGAAKLREIVNCMYESGLGE